MKFIQGKNRSQISLFPVSLDEAIVEKTLEFDDILHYQKIIVALTKTNRLMKEIDKIKIEQQK